MQSSEQTVLRDLVLVGGGHSHVGVLRMFAMKPMPGLRITVICTDTDTPYSGMLPGYVAGHYSFDEVHIDLGRLAAATGARLYRDEVVGIDRQTQKVICRHRPPVAYDLLSINIGSTPQIQQIEGAQALAVPVKPIAQFNQRWLQLLAKVREWRGRMTVAVVGGGAGGVELLLAMQYRLRHELKALGRNPEDLKFVLLTAADSVLPTHNSGVRERFMKVLRERNVEVHTGAEVVQVSPGCLHTQNGRTFDADETMWVTQAGGAASRKSRGLRGAHGQAAGGQFAPQLARPKPAALHPPTPLAGLDLHRQPLCRGLTRTTGLCRGLGVALEGPHRPPVHEALQHFCAHERKRIATSQAVAKLAAPGPSDQGAAERR
jgi:selenide,water dikinase